LFGDVLFGLAGRVGVLYCMVRSYCGMVWNREVLHRVVKFCPVKYCYARHAKALLRRGQVWFCTALQSDVLCGKVLLRLFLVVWSIVRRCSVCYCPVWFGMVLFGEAE
jgi:hypothetical protein